jgi:hypothetical protein
MGLSEQTVEPQLEDHLDNLRLLDKKVHCCNTVVTLPLCLCHCVVTLLSYWYYTVFTLFFNSSHTIPTLSLHCPYTVLTISFYHSHTI